MIFIMVSILFEMNATMNPVQLVKGAKKNHLLLTNGLYKSLGSCYSTTNVIGSVYFTPTGLPLCFPGVISGNN